MLITKTTRFFSIQSCSDEKYIFIRFQKLSSVVEKGERMIKTAENCSKLMSDDDNNDTIVVYDECENDEVCFESYRLSGIVDILICTHIYRSWIKCRNSGSVMRGPKCSVKNWTSNVRDCRRRIKI